MKSFRPLPFLAVLLFAGHLPPAANAASNLEKTTLQQVVNDVSIIPAGATTGRKAKINDLFLSPDIIRTGANSRAELLAADQTLTRLGANTVFSFQPASREINLQQGSVLFHAPTGRGGGIIKTGAATAAVTGTTIIVATTRNGGFKTIVLEGTCRVQLPGGKRLDLVAGQLSFIMPGSRQFSAPINFDLGALTQGSQLVTSFSAPLPSLGRINREVSRQSSRIAQRTKLEIGDVVGKDKIRVIDNSSREAQISDGARFLLSLHNDALIDSNKLNPLRIFTNANRDEITSAVGEPPEDIGTFSAFFARNIRITTSTLELPPISGLDSFIIFANKDLHVDGSLTVTGSAHEFGLHAQEKLTIANGSTITYQDGDLFAESLGSMDYTNVSFQGNEYLFLSSEGGDVHLQGGNLQAQNIVVEANDLIKLVGTTFTNAQSISMDSRTSFFINISFPNVPVNIGCQTGAWDVQSFAGPASPGKANFLNCQYNSIFLTPGQGSGNIPGTGIFVFPNGS